MLALNTLFENATISCVTPGSGADGEDVQMEDMEESQGKGKSALLFPATTEIPQLKNVSFKRKSAFEVTESAIALAVSILVVLVALLSIFLHQHKRKSSKT